MKDNVRFINRRTRYARGFTLVELMVAAVIIGVAILAVAAVARKTREIDVTFQHHRIARAILDSCLESAAYKYTNYNNMANDSRTVIIEDRADGLTDLTGALTITVTQKQTDDLNSTPLTYKEVSASLTWAEPEGNQTITIKKAVTEP